jgi:hypothetical protein
MQTVPCGTCGTRRRPPWAGKDAAWSGWSIDNPSNNYYYSFLKATMLLGLGARGELASAEGWVTRLRTGVDGTLQITSGGSTLVDTTLLPGIASLQER